jgi:hypothetical protein
MNEESRKSLDAIPPAARLALAAALIKSLPREQVREMVDAMQAGGKPIPDVEIINGAGLSPEQIEQAVTGTFAAHEREVLRRPATPLEVDDFTRAHVPPLRVGDVIRWRPGYRNCEWPGDDEDVVVSQVFAQPLRDASNLNHSDAAVRHDIAIAYVSSDQRAMPGIFEFCFDSRRFERVDTMTPAGDIPDWLLKAKAPVPEGV